MTQQFSHIRTDRITALDTPDYVRVGNAGNRTNEWHRIRNGGLETKPAARNLRAGERRHGVLREPQIANEVVRIDCGPALLRIATALPAAPHQHCTVV